MATKSYTNTYRGPGQEFLTAKVERDLLERWIHQGDPRALDRLVSSHKPLVLKHATRLRSGNLGLADLVQEGCVGLLEAAHRFDLNQEVRFATYAQWWIKAAIQDFADRNASSVRTVTSTKQRSLLFGLRRMLKDPNGSVSLTSEAKQEMATRYGVSPDTVDRVLSRISIRDLSIDAPWGEDAGMTLGDTLTDDADTAEDLLAEDDERRYRRKLLAEGLDTLTSRERLIVQRRHLDEKGAILLELGDELGVSKERVRQIEKRALEKLVRAVRNGARSNISAHIA